MLWSIVSLMCFALLVTPLPESRPGLKPGCRDRHIGTAGGLSQTDLEAALRGQKDLVASVVLLEEVANELLVGTRSIDDLRVGSAPLRSFVLATHGSVPKGGCSG